MCCSSQFFVHVMPPVPVSIFDNVLSYSGLGNVFVKFFQVGSYDRYKWSEIKPTSRVKEPQLQVYKAIYRGYNSICNDRKGPACSKLLQCCYGKISQASLFFWQRSLKASGSLGDELRSQPIRSTSA